MAVTELQEESAHVTPNAMRRAWEAAFSDMVEKMRAYQEYGAAMQPLLDLQYAFVTKHNLEARVQAAGKPLYRLEQELLKENPIYRVPDQVHHNHEALCALYTAADDVVMATPAPDLAALRWKIDRTSQATYTAEFLAQMNADMDRLLGPSHPLVIEIRGPEG